MDRRARSRKRGISGALLKVAFLAAAAINLVDAQSSREVQLGAATDSLTAEVSGILSVRELADGRALMTQRDEPALAVVDFGGDAMRPLGRSGSGPGEYRFAWTLTALPEDSTLLSDFSLRWLLFVADRIVATIPAQDPAVRAVTFAAPHGADRWRHVLSINFRPPTRDGYSDSSDVALVDRRTGQSEVVAALRTHPDLEGERQWVSRGGGRGALRVPLDHGGQALLFPDGWIAVARIAPYSVDWRKPDGSWVHGPVLSGPPVRFSNREKQTYGARNPWAVNLPIWPRYVPPFDANALLATSDGQLLVARLPTADHPGNRYEIIDRRGVVAGVIVTAPDERIVGLGSDTVYVVREDDVGIQHLSRHPWPFRRAPR